jgi:iron(III) transport system permease protein
LINSILMGLAVAVGASLIAVPLAFLTARTDMPLRRVISALVWVVFFTPSFVMASAWLVLVSTGGIIDQVHPLPGFVAANFFSIWGVIFILSMKLFPFVYLSMRAGLAGLGSEFSDAARTLGSGPWRAFLRVDLPLLLPALLAGG